MNEDTPCGTKRIIDGVERVYYYGYWIKTYEAPASTLDAKKRLIEALTRRLFNHVEHGINIPGRRLGEARAAFEAETDPELKRVKGAMLAGALFNRATDIFTKLVDLQAVGVEIATDNALMRECGRCLQDALQLGRTVQHRSGDEGIDELWGEPFKAFSIPVEAFYESRYNKIAAAMRDIDAIANALSASFVDRPMFAGVDKLAAAYAETARIKSEVLRTDADIFDVWARFAVAGERLWDFSPVLPEYANERVVLEAEHGVRLIRQARDLISDITRARVSMPKSTEEFAERCAEFARRNLRQDPL
ncbi:MULTISPECIES: hypothetical protein [Uliginosibacterium]|uniref:Uncharacterized protein n=1 Tax=Uliginosibacterium aquaticum TaxID=2731212 RepID=A0ABX2IIL7_9RHOO|nr:MULTISPECIES: hypothetical protein [Uliginosibacterium]MDO6387535.1 hypothetical protein [Uliginosibacterium sp. 31-12]NSL56585.1 hypothetical protein [Uliginosibacterium aquaticum]PLK47416.1 hypothetical protein C0V76_17330 [Uliginosibacterium sp. TH139]